MSELPHAMSRVPNFGSRGLGLGTQDSELGTLHVGVRTSDFPMPVIFIFCMQCCFVYSDLCVGLCCLLICPEP
jgi:hypothetical protein